MSTNLGYELYTGAADFGRIRATIGVIIGTFISIIAIIGGIYLISKQTKFNKNVMGTISNSPSCIPYIENKNTMYNCYNLNVYYKVNNTEYKIDNQSINNIDHEYKENDEIIVYYNENDPNSTSLTSDNTHIIGWISIVVGLFILISYWLWFYFSMKYKFIAASQGLAGTASLISSATRVI